MKNHNITTYKVFATAVLMAAFVSCSDEDSPKDPVPVDPTDPVYVETFPGPTYPDNYTSIAGWENRAQWNLANVHDPSVVKEGNYFYMYQTDASYGNAHEGHGHFHSRRSTDLVNWEYIGSTMTAAPAWVKDTMNSKRAQMGLPAIDNPSFGFWAPCVRKVGSVYRMYYSIVVNNLITGTDPNTSWGERPYIGLMETTSLESNNWVDKGMVVCSETDGATDYIRSGGNDWYSYYKFNGIDPSYIITQTGEHKLIYGSWMTGIASLDLDPATGKPTQLNTIDDYGTRIAGRGNLANNRWQALEGAEVIYNPDTGYYYMFVAYDELSVAYNTRVARSQNINGPYLGYNGEDVSAGAECWPMLTHPYAFGTHTGWVGISHCSVFKDEATGKWFFASQGRLPENVPGINVSNAVMMGHVRELQWTSDGWPTVAPERYAAVPQVAITNADLTGTWDVITMEYQYRQIQRSASLVLNANGTFTGAMSGNWAYDDQTRTLMLNDQECKVSNGWDWEASPRRRTITISGFTGTGRPIWGKRKY
ncbi:MAG: arabinan endo-1,5-alpha-L-arabinosidase [Flavobacterium sp.]|uniref:arabinan endo-1,5-alpha-L-arabinosidase n=1 Tax=Flavobacterium sp. TaxID=239 RepID=UPI0011F7CF4F|nr:arabinan endo-1,5-alpha-L-arabinosidase [Flavobacterium sp.]RZJ68672.1 MAG: arabinan endo-1,5-alpha-L-arabinosidase [Flavobacterium sp.]